MPPMKLELLLPVFSYGTAVGWISPMGPRLMSKDTPAREPVHQDVVSWMASVVYIVGVPAVFIFGYIVDNFGRKVALMLTSLSMALYSTETWALITARAIIGLGVSGSYVVTPLYIKEISEDSIRGTLGSLVVLSQNFGNLVVYIIGEYLSYQATLWICLSVPLIHLLVFAAMPETPSYLLKTGKVEEARDVLAWLRCRQVTDASVEISDSSTFHAFRITLTITVARELCGCLAVLHFASLIFSQASGSWVLSPNQQAAMLGVVQLIGSIALTALGTWFYVGSGTAAWVPVLALCLCIYCDAAGLQPVPFVVMTEMFSFQHRGTVTSIVIAFACALVSLELRVFQPIASYFGLYLIFWIFAGVCIVSTIYIFWCVPETKMKSIEEIYAQLGKKKKGIGKDLEADVTRL
ncbi:unnamed protein product [Leptidea sinapis]|uniref:Major facilitator superfamily (MFS) profile domain-containing protein n=1 Tax=Leptidea sinapis TaxID=189913 RepID=A0A5E4QRR8_9NEOP|nr:unnamed protein product [Leptidea sinapis]